MAKNQILLDTISKAEGTSDTQAKAEGYKSGYEVTLGYGKYDHPGSWPPVNQLKMKELDTFQTGMLNNNDAWGSTPRNKRSSAVGRYQITRTTRRDLQDKLGYSDDQVFDDTIQDNMANSLIGEKGINFYNADKKSLDSTQNGIADVWQGLPRTDGTVIAAGGGYQVGKAGISQTEFRTALVDNKKASKATNPGKGITTAGKEVQDSGYKFDPDRFPPIPATDAEKNTTLNPKVQENAKANSDDGGYVFNPTRFSSNPDDFKTVEELKKIETSKSVFSVPYDPQPNLFQQFSTMTYSISIYFLKAEQYTKLLKTNIKTVNGFKLIMQSGGITSNAGGNYGATASKFFENDYYIDNFQIKNATSGTSSQGAFAVTDIKFTVTEPAGITFQENLIKLMDEEGLKNYTAQNFLAVIRFYGYDDNGNQIKGSELESMSETLTDPAAVGEKFVPFLFKSIQFQLNSGKVEYSVSAASQMMSKAYGRFQGTIPATFRLSGNTLKDVLKGNTRPGVYGLEDVLNKHEVNVSKDLFDQPNRYVIEFEKNQGFEEEKILQEGSQYFSTSGMNVSKDGQESRFLQDKVSVKIKEKEMSIQAGTSILKLIDVIMQTSTYITKQYKTVVDPASGKTTIGEINENEFKWYRIRPEVKQLGWDEKRNDFAYEIKYIIARYKFDSTSLYASLPNKKCFSVHKEYNYWFTGKNTEVIDFKQDFNALWGNAITHKTANVIHPMYNNLNNTVINHAEYNSGGTNTHGVNDSTNISAHIAAELYSPADLQTTTITIVGDPDLFIQTGIFYSPGQLLGGPFAESPFVKDGSVNSEVSEINFTINFNTIVDYNLNTGLADVTVGNVKGEDGGSEIANQSIVYRLNHVTTELAGGKFTQILYGSRKEIQPDCRTTLKRGATARREDPDETKTTQSVKPPSKNSQTSAPALVNTTADRVGSRRPANNNAESRDTASASKSTQTNAPKAPSNDFDYEETFGDEAYNYDPPPKSLNSEQGPALVQDINYYAEEIESINTDIIASLKPVGRIVNNTFTRIEQLGTDLADAIKGNDDGN